MITFKVLGNYAPNLKGLPGSSYLIKGFSKLILIDLGNGNCKKFINEIGIKNIGNAILFLSHNHIDHSFDVLRLIKYLRKNDCKLKIYLPKKSLMYWYINSIKYYDVNIINSETTFYLDDFKFSFCRTVHRGECYSIKIEKENQFFVYTSDMSCISKELREFCKNANSVLIDAGFPKKRKFYLKGYHGNTKKLLQDLFSDSCNVNKVYVSHLKANLKDEDYVKVFPENKNVEIVKMGLEYDTLT